MLRDILHRLSDTPAAPWDALSLLALLAAGALAAWTGWVCRSRGETIGAGADAAVWAVLAAAFALYALVKMAHLLGLGQGFGGWLRDLAREHALYAGRRPVQIAVSVVISMLALATLLYGLYWLPEVVKRYRLAIGLAALALGFALIRFVSLHEIDAWVAELPWTRPVVDGIASLGASLLALSRLHSIFGPQTRQAHHRGAPAMVGEPPRGDKTDQR